METWSSLKSGEQEQGARCMVRMNYLPEKIEKIEAKRKESYNKEKKKKSWQ